MSQHLHFESLHPGPFPTMSKVHRALFEGVTDAPSDVCLLRPDGGLVDAAQRAFPLSHSFRVADWWTEVPAQSKLVLAVTSVRDMERLRVTMAECRLRVATVDWSRIDVDEVGRTLLDLGWSPQVASIGSELDRYFAVFDCIRVKRFAGTPACELTIAVLTMGDSNCIALRSPDLTIPGNPSIAVIDSREWADHCNLLIATTSARYVVLVNGHSYLPFGWVEQFRVALALSNATVVGVSGVADAGELLGHVIVDGRRLKRGFGSAAGVDPHVVAVLSLSGAFVDPRFASMFGTDLVLQARSRGGQACVIDMPVYLSGKFGDYLPAADSEIRQIVAKWNRPVRTNRGLVCPPCDQPPQLALAVLLGPGDVDRLSELEVTGPWAVEIFLVIASEDSACLQAAHAWAEKSPFERTTVLDGSRPWNELVATARSTIQCSHLLWANGLDSVLKAAMVDRLPEELFDDTRHDRLLGPTFKVLEVVQQTPSRNRDQSEQPLISLTMIVKNEGHQLADCLESVARCVDEIVVVDTGSSDDTIAIARSFGAKVVESTWVDSFSASRNEALSHASGRWILWMDADDRLDGNDQAKLVSLRSRLTDENVAFVFKCVCAAPKGSPTIVDHVRLFPRRPGVSWRYRVHEQILPSLRSIGVQPIWTDIEVQHTGYADRGLREVKLQRDLRLIGLALQEAPPDPFTLFNLGTILYDLGRPKEAVEPLRRSLAESSPSDSIVRKAYALLIRCYRDIAEPGLAFQECEQALRTLPADPELLFLQGLLFRDAGQLVDAQRSWTKLLELRSADHFASIDRGILGYKTDQNLAVLAMELGNLELAVHHWQRALVNQPGYLPALDGLAEVARQRSDWSLLESVVSQMELLDVEGKESAATFAIRSHLDRGNNREALRLCDAKLQQFPLSTPVRHLRAVALANLGELKSAIEDVLLALGARPDDRPLLSLLERLTHDVGSSTSLVLIGEWACSVLPNELADPFASMLTEAGQISVRMAVLTPLAIVPLLLSKARVQWSYSQSGPWGPILKWVAEDRLAPAAASPDTVVIIDQPIQQDEWHTEGARRIIHFALGYQHELAHDDWTIELELPIARAFVRRCNASEGP